MKYRAYTILAVSLLLGLPMLAGADVITDWNEKAVNAGYAARYTASSAPISSRAASLSYMPRMIATTPAPWARPSSTFMLASMPRRRTVQTSKPTMFSRGSVCDRTLTQPLTP